MTPAQQTQINTAYQRLKATIEAAIREATRRLRDE